MDTPLASPSYAPDYTDSGRPPRVPVPVLRFPNWVVDGFPSLGGDLDDIDDELAIVCDTERYFLAKTRTTRLRDDACGIACPDARKDRFAWTISGTESSSSPVLGQGKVRLGEQSARLSSPLSGRRRVAIRRRSEVVNGHRRPTVTNLDCDFTMDGDQIRQIPNIPRKDDTVYQAEPGRPTEAALTMPSISESLAPDRNRRDSDVETLPGKSGSSPPLMPIPVQSSRNARLLPWKQTDLSNSPVFKPISSGQLLGRQKLKPPRGKALPPLNMHSLMSYVDSDLRLDELASPTTACSTFESTSAFSSWRSSPRQEYYSDDDEELVIRDTESVLLQLSQSLPIVSDVPALSCSNVHPDGTRSANPRFRRLSDALQYASNCDDVEVITSPSHR